MAAFDKRTKRAAGIVVQVRIVIVVTTADGRISDEKTATDTSLRDFIPRLCFLTAHLGGWCRFYPPPEALNKELSMHKCPHAPNAGHLHGAADRVRRLGSCGRTSWRYSTGNKEGFDGVLQPSSLLHLIGLQLVYTCKTKCGK